MKKQFENLKAYVGHPMIVLFPLFCFLLFNSFFNYFYVASACLLLSGLLFLLLHRIRQGVLNSALLFVVIPLIGVLFIYWSPSLTFFQHKVNLFVEMVVWVETSIYLLFRRPIVRLIERRYAGLSNMRAKIFGDEFFYIIRLVYVAFSIHIVVVSLYYLLDGWDRTEEQDNFFFDIAPLLLLGVVALYECWRTRFFRGELSKEVWLPIVDDKGNVKGLVARSVTFASGNRHCNPVVRMVFEQGGMLYVRPRDEEAHIQVGKLDYPIGGYLPFRVPIEAFVRRMLAPYDELAQLPARLLLRYIHHDEQTNRLTFLFLVQIPALVDLSKVVPGGKLWTKNMVEANVEKGVFSTFFEEEYSFLKDTILLES